MKPEPVISNKLDLEINCSDDESSQSLEGSSEMTDSSEEDYVIQQGTQRLISLKKLQGKINFEKIDDLIIKMGEDNLKNGYKRIEQGLLENLVVDEAEIMYGD